MPAPAFLAAAFISFVGGAMIVMQAPINARLGSIVGGPLWAAFFSFLCGVIALGLTLLITRKPLPFDNIGQTQGWMWIGGVMGAAFVVTTIFAVPRLGAGLMIALIIAGQLSFAILMDHYGFLVPERPVTTLRIAGAALVMAGAFMIFKG